MGMALFVLGVIGFIVCFFIHFFLVDEVDEEFTPIVMWVLAFLTLLFFNYGGAVFDTTPHKWILFSAAVIIVLVYGIYSIWYFIDDVPDFWMLFYIPPAALEVVFIINTFVNLNLSWLNSLLTIMYWVLLVAAIISFMYGIFYRGVVYSRNKIKEENNQKSLEEVTLWNPNSAAIRLIGISKEQLNIVLSKSYELLRSEHKDDDSYYLRYSLERKIRESLEGLSENTRKLLFSRIEYADFYRQAKNITFQEFTQLLLPEVFKQTGDMTSLVQERLLEDLPSRITKMVVSDLGNKNNSADNRQIFQTQIREVFHSLVTPVRTIANAVSIINKSRNNVNFEEVLSENLRILTNNSMIISSLLYAYRGSAFSMNYADSNISIKSFIIETIRSLNVQLRKNVKAEIDDFKYAIEGYSKNQIIALLLPLLQNAIEASPDERVVEVREKSNNGFVEIIVKNSTIENVNVSNLQENSVITKGNGKNDHEGLGIPSVKRLANSLQIGFDIISENMTFVAILKFPTYEKES